MIRNLSNLRSEMNKRIRKHCFIALILTGLLLSFTANAELKIHFIDVGQGDAILVQCDGNNLLIDAGPENAGMTVHDYLIDKANITRIDYVIATHEHDDHLGGMPEALSGLVVGNVYSGTSIPLRYWLETIIPKLKEKTLTVLKPTEGESFELGEAKVTFLATMTNAEIPNDRCLTVRIDYGDNSALLMADLERDGENWLLEHETQLKADVLKVGHHGGNTSTGEKFLRAVDPQIAVISVGTGNKHGHPHEEILNLLKKYNVTIYRTDLFGTIVLTSDKSIWSVEVMKAR